MQIVIPMSGFGERFRRAGYTVPKPLIEIDGKPIIGHVIDMFPGEQDLIFVCNQDHLNDPQYRMRAILREYCPTGRVVGIPPHKLGPVHAVRQIDHLIDPDRPVIINYCDFTCYWNWNHFKRFVVETACAGAIPAYKGFHPHTLGSTNYAYLRNADGWVLDIQEKQPYTDNRMAEYASSGTYYFASGKLMRDALRATVEQKLNVAGEYYVSLAYKPLLTANRPIAVYPLQHFMQWGTPEDVSEYKKWSTAFKRLLSRQNTAIEPIGSAVIVMAGLGQRFANEGYCHSKPLIPVSGRPMVAQATHDLPGARHYVFVLRGNMPGHEKISGELKRLYPNALIETIDGVTQGQACTAKIGLDALGCAAGGISGPVTFGACDNGVLYDPQAFQRLIDNPDVDVIVWVARGHVHAMRQPKMFGWVNADHGQVRGISVKAPLESPSTDPIALGTFTFRRAQDFYRVLEHLIARDGRVNGEFYIDSCINDAVNLGLRCHLFEVETYLSWGTPQDLQTFEYWQSCFHKWDGHPYRLELDGRVPCDALPALAERYRETTPDLPGAHP